MRTFLGLLLLVVSLDLGGCGGCNDNNGVGHLPDAPPAPDAAAADAMPPDAVSLAVINHGVPAVGVTVYFLNADGSVAKAAVTDDNGIATAVITAGGSVTAIRPFTTQQPPQGKFAPDELRTFLGVKPGDHLVLSRAPVDTVQVTFDAAAPDGGDFGTSYQVLTTCGSGTTSIDPGGSGNGSGSPDPGGTRELQNCNGAADIAVLASQNQVEGRARAGALESPQGLYHANVSLPPDGDVMLSLRDDAYADLTDVTFTYMNGPDATINIAHWPVLPNGFLGPYQTEAGDSATISEVAVPATMEVVDSSLTVNNLHDVIDWGPYSTTYSLDLANVLLREVTGGPTFDAATGKISWTEAPDGVTPSLTIAAILVRRTEPTLAKWHWEIAAPYSPNGIVLPHLPTDVFDWAPVDSDEIDLDPIKNVQVTGGYDAVRSHILDIHDETGPTGYVIGNAGRAVIATSIFQPLPQPLRQPLRR